MRIYKIAQNKIQFKDLNVGDQFYHSHYGISEKTGENTYNTNDGSPKNIRNIEDQVSIIRSPEEQTEKQTMGIGSNAEYPSAALSNFSPHSFSIDGVSCASMEGFLQSLKFDDPERQRQICALVGGKAKGKGRKRKWFLDQTLYWLGKPMDRHGSEYQSLLDRAFNAMFESSEPFRNALKASGKATLTHSIGKDDAKATILTINEFIKRLVKLRSRLT